MPRMVLDATVTTGGCIINVLLTAINKQNCRYYQRVMVKSAGIGDGW